MSDRLKEIAERAKRATPGPWRRGQMPEWESWMIVSESAFDPGDEEDPTPIHRPIVDSEYTAPSDAEFIAAAREDIPWLLAEVERLRNRPALSPFTGEDVLPE